MRMTEDSTAVCKKEIVTNVVAPIQQEGFTVKANAAIMSILSEKLYAEPQLAVIRELTSNALDAHIASGIEKEVPIEVSLPNALSERLIIKDFGVGMSGDFLLKQFTCFGETTKSECGTSIGGFGIGAKSPFAISDSFTVVSVHKGKRSTALCRKEKGSIPEITFLEKDVPCVGVTSGTTITIDNVKPFNGTTIESVVNLFIFYPLPPTITGVKLPCDFLNRYIQLDEGVYLAPIYKEGARNDYLSRDEVRLKVYAKVGHTYIPQLVTERENIYNKEAVTVLNSLKSYFGTRYFTLTLFIDVDPLTYPVSPSRERLVLTDSKMTALLDKVKKGNQTLERVVSEEPVKFMDDVFKAFKGCFSKEEQVTRNACVLYNDHFKGFTYLQNRTFITATKDMAVSYPFHFLLHEDTKNLVTQNRRFRGRTIIRERGKRSRYYMPSSHTESTPIVKNKDEVALIFGPDLKTLSDVTNKYPHIPLTFSHLLEEETEKVKTVRGPSSLGQKITDFDSLPVIRGSIGRTLTRDSLFCFLQEANERKTLILTTRTALPKVRECVDNMLTIGAVTSYQLKCARKEYPLLQQKEKEGHVVVVCSEGELNEDKEGFLQKLLRIKNVEELRKRVRDTFVYDALKSDDIEGLSLLRVLRRDESLPKDSPCRTGEIKDILDTYAGIDKFVRVRYSFLEGFTSQKAEADVFVKKIQTVLNSVLLPLYGPLSEERCVRNALLVGSSRSASYILKGYHSSQEYKTAVEKYNNNSERSQQV